MLSATFISVVLSVAILNAVLLSALAPFDLLKMLIVIFRNLPKNLRTGLETGN